MELFTVSANDNKGLEDSLQALRTDGVIFVREAVDTEFLAILKRRMDEDTPRLLEFCEANGGNPRDKGQLQQAAPPFPPFLHEDILANPFVWNIVHRLLGPGAGLMFYGGNTACPDSSAQNVHLDQAHKSDKSTPIRSLVVSIGPQATTKRNGATEIWPGTHTIISEMRVPPEFLEQQRKRRPPVQLETDPGDIVIRDARLWHRAVENPSTEYRHMLGAVFHTAPKGPVMFDNSARTFVEATNVNLNAAYSDLSEDYLFAPTRWLLGQGGESDMTASAADGGAAKPLSDI